jgi:hypothetical protein
MVLNPFFSGSGILNIKHIMQIRKLRQTHVDNEYCKAIFKYLKGMTTMLANVVHASNPGMIMKFMSMDE